MKNGLMLSAALVLLCLISGCASVDVTQTSKGSYPATNPNDVEVLMTQPKREFIELGSVTVTGFDSDEDAKMHNALRAKAAPLGANAIIIQNQGLTPTGWGNFEKWATAVAIRYKC